MSIPPEETPGAAAPTRFHVASPDDIRSGRVTDVYFLRGQAMLQDEGENPEVVMEVRASTLPAEHHTDADGVTHRQPWQWGVFAGLDELMTLLER